MNLISIGKFSHLTGLSVRALRIYAAQGLLEPQFTDKTTGYRFYHTSQAAIAKKIKILRQCEMSLEQILQVLQQPKNAHELLQQHRDFVQERMNHHLKMLHHLDTMLSFHQSLNEISYRDTAEQSVVYLSKTMNMAERSSYFEIGTALGQLYELIRVSNLHINGAPFRMYPTALAEATTEVTVCIPVHGEVLDAAEQYHTVLPARRCVYTVHSGEYTNLFQTLTGLLDQLHSHRLEVVGEVQETYLEHPLSVSDPNLYRTELAIPIA
jgi:DNA-binding transcriptional MerR regulator